MASVKLTILSDNMRGTSFVLSDKQYTLGRSESADISIPEGTVSGTHCTIFRSDEGNYCVHDEGSTNGTRVNGRKLEDEVVPLENGDLLQVGGVEMMFENSEESGASSEKTITVISLADQNVGSQSNSVKNLSSLNVGGNSIKPSNSLRSNKKHNAIFYSILGVLVIVVVVTLIYFILKTAK